MNRTALALAFALGALALEPANAATFTPTFDTPAFPGTQYDVGATENAYYLTTYGITVSNSYLYKDSRDTFDGVGIANGNVGEIGTAQIGRIDFIDKTDFVAVDYLAILLGVYSAYDALGNLLDQFTIDGTGIASGATGTHTLSGGLISYMEFSGRGGYTALSGLTYNYDGLTDGKNDDIGVSAVPLPAGGLLLVGAIGGLAALRRRKA